MGKLNAKKRAEYLVRAALGAVSCFLFIRLAIYLDGIERYRNSVPLSIVWIVGIVVSGMYALSKLISSSEVLSKLFVGFAVSRSTPRSITTKRALRMLRTEKEQGIRTNAHTDIVFLSVLLVAGVVIWLLGAAFIERNAGWLAGMLLLVFGAYAVTKMP